MAPGLGPVFRTFVSLVWCAASVAAAGRYGWSLQGHKPGTQCVGVTGRIGTCLPTWQCVGRQRVPSTTTTVLCGYRSGRALVCCERLSAPAVRSRAVPATVTIDREDECGRATRSDDSRMRRAISGGRDAQKGHWPWMVLLGMKENWSERERGSGPRWTCGGVLLTRRHVLTAAHCVLPPVGMDGPLAEKLVVRLGEFNLSTTLDGPHADVPVRRVVRHPLHRDRQNDLALLELATEVHLVGHVRHICLPQLPPDDSGRRQARVAGWGRLTFNGPSLAVLQEAQLTLVEREACEDVYRQLHSFNTSFPGGFNGTKLCAVDDLGGGADACLGDSGGPLTVENADGSHSVLGIVSLGIGCGNPAFPGVYTRVASYLNWINSEIRRSRW